MTKRTILALISATLISVATPHIARAGHWWVDSTGNPIHLNKGRTPGLSLTNKASNGSATAIEHARGDWSAASWAVDIGNWPNDGADVHAWDGHYCGVGWSGIATPYTNTWGPSTAYPDGHVDHMWVQINVCSTGSYASNANYKGTRAVACQEIGHAIGGMLHQGPGCMGFSYTNSNAEDPAQRSPSTHDLEHINWLWSGYH